MQVWAGVPFFSILKLLEEWESKWMWKRLQLTGEDGRLRRQYKITLVVTDGSYIKELFPMSTQQSSFWYAIKVGAD